MIPDKDVTLVFCSRSLRSWKQLQTSPSSKECSRRSPHPFWRMHFLQEKIKSRDFQAMGLWCGPNTEHNTWPYFPKTPSVSFQCENTRQHSISLCCFQPQSITGSLGEWCLNVSFGLLFLMISCQNFIQQLHVNHPVERDSEPLLQF